MKRLLRALAFFWVLFTAAVWFYASAKALLDPSNTFGMGLVQAEGRNALWFTLPAAAVALGGCVLVWRKQAVGAWLLFVYGLFWGAALLGGAAKDVYEHHHLGYEIYSPEELHQVLVVQVVLAAFFLLFALWTWRNRTASPLRSPRPLR